MHFSAQFSLVFKQIIFCLLPAKLVLRRTPERVDNIITPETYARQQMSHTHTCENRPHGDLIWIITLLMPKTTSKRTKQKQL